VASKPGGLNVRNGDDRETPSAVKSLSGTLREADPLLDLGKADDGGEETGMCTLRPAGIWAQASWERLAEQRREGPIPSRGWPQPAKPTGYKCRNTKSWWRVLVWRMSSSERRRRGSALRGGAGRHPDASNARGRQRGSGHLAVPWMVNGVSRRIHPWRTSLKANSN